MTADGASAQLPTAGIEPVPAGAAAVFGDRLELARQYAGRLAADGVTRGLIGPRELPRLWERHLLNSAVLTDFVPAATRVVDVGSGAGLPGIPMAIRRPDLQIDLVEPMQRRVDFLAETVTELGLAGQLRVIRGRAEERSVRATAGAADWVVARAVAPLDRLAAWCLPLLAPGGRLLALKGERAEAEVAEHRRAISELGGCAIEVRRAGERELGEPTWVVIVERGQRPHPRRRGRG